MPTQRLYLEDPRRKTALAAVSGRAAGGFLLDKTLFHAADPSYHHLQPCDRGHLLAEGHKLKIDKVSFHRGELIHRTEGPMPSAGAKAQLHLDAPRREVQARAHTAMHLLVTAMAENYGVFLEPPSVVGGGEIRASARFRDASELVLPRVVARANQLLGTREDVTAMWAPREDAAKMISHDIVPLSIVAPAEPTLRLVRCGARSVLPCDAPLVANLREVGTLILSMVQPRREGVRFGVRVQESG